MLNKKLLPIFLFLTFSILSPIARAEFFNGKTQFYTIKTEHFYIHYSEGLGPTAEEMRTITEKVYDRMTKRLGWAPSRRVNVVLTDKSEISNGVASVLPDDNILLYMAPPTPDSTLDHYRDYYEYLFSHEYTHILHIDQHHRLASVGRFVLGKIVSPNGATPSWMREGMAVYEESLVDPKFGRNHSDYTDMVLRSSYYAGRFPRIDQIAGLTAHYPDGSGPYLFGGKFFEWLASHYGEDRIYEYQKVYGSSLVPFLLNSKARQVFGKSFYDLWREFEADLAGRFDAEKAALTAKGLTLLTGVLKTDESLHYYTPMPDGSGVAYYTAGLDETPRIVIQKNDGSEPLIIKRRLYGQMAFSKNGRYLAFASLSSVEKKTTLADVFYYDLETKKLSRVFDVGNSKKSMRLMDPDFSPADGGERWIVAVRNFQNSDQLVVFDLLERQGYVISKATAKTQFSNPRFSPDGSKIVVSRKDPKTGFRDIVIYNKVGDEITQVTNDIKIDLHPVFSANGSKVYFSSARTGVFNIFAYDLKSGTLTQLTNVLDGVFQPMPSKDPKELYVQHFGIENNDIEKFNPNNVNKNLEHMMVGTNNDLSLSDSILANNDLPLQQNPIDLPSDNLALRDLLDVAAVPEFVATDANFAQSDTKNTSDDPKSQQQPTPEPDPDVDTQQPPSLPKEKTSDTHVAKKDKKQKGESHESNVAKTYPSKYKRALTGNPHEMGFDRYNPPDAKRYSAFPQILRPAYVVPNLQMYDNAALISAQIGRFDALYRHSWLAFVNYRTDAQFTGGGGTYVYSRYNPSLYVGGQRYVVDWGTITTTTASSRFFEQRWQAYTGMSYKWKQQSLNASYFYEHRSPLTQLAGVNLVNMQPYAGVKFQYKIADSKRFADSISQEDGYLVKIALDVTNQALLSDAVNEEVVGIADLRYYFEMPWSNHHVFAVRAVGGAQLGDRQQFGTFRMGGPFGEGTGAVIYSPRIFPLRGLAGITFGGDYALMAAAEYRLPLVENVNAGIGTLPIFIDKFYLVFFTDAGDVEYHAETRDFFSNILVAPGLELRSDVVIGYGLPITTRVGYGIVLTNRDRLGSLTDAITMSSLKYGSVFLQVGTSF